jgi:hypothetical protein
MKETITYKKRIGVNTKDVLRTIKLEDQHWLKTVMLGYLCLESADPRADFKIWFNKPNDKLPRQPLVGNAHNSPKSFAEGILAKLEQDPKRRDLSPKQCEGLEQLSMLMSDIYDIPRIVFEEQGLPKSTIPDFTKLFKKTATK